MTGASGLDLVFDDGSSRHLPLAILARGASAHGRATIHRDDAPDWRLVLYDAPDDWLKLLPRVGHPRRHTTIGYATAAATVVAIGVGLWLAGGWLLDLAAAVVPHGMMEPVGRAVVAQLGGNNRCIAASGQEALDRLVERLRPSQGFVEPVSVIVADMPIVNAFAAPGGRIVIFKGLIDQAQSPDEIAGVLAHELTHVQLRHPAKALLRQAGLSMLVQSLSGDMGEAVDFAVLMRSSRDAERAADAGALDLLRQARISPAGFDDFFKRMEKRKAPAEKRDASTALLEKLGSFTSTHPGGAERIATVEKAEADGWPATPAMPEKEWKAFRAICHKIESTEDEE